ncbi:MAG: protein phosphatase 2C domain-containing protein [Roseburia sp.]|nr:protein phosphatase 2C domain-containing protein [Roseburia sp.]MCM1278568.1 protein phosphatase 2C domain-containing protein [Robinsoniella sp.]
MITWHTVTDKGGRDHNEDAVKACEYNGRYCFVLADGLGGHGKGEVASNLVVQSVFRDFMENYERDSFLKTSLQHAQEALLKEQREENCPMGMKTTVVCLIVDGNYVQWGFSGDSRLYYFRKKKLKMRTIDHSVPQMLALTKEIKEKQIRFHEDRNRLLKVLGMEYDKPVFEISPIMEKKENRQFLLCSDGFWELVMEKDMEKQLKIAKSPEEWIKALEQIVLKNGAGKNMDNYSAVGVWME